MPDVLPIHPLTGVSGFRNPAKVSVATWEVVKEFGRIAEVTVAQGELGWIERAWRVLEKTIWVQHSDAFEWHRVMIRFFSLVELVHIYCHLADIASFEREYKYGEWADECGLSKVKFAVLCGEEFLEDQFVGDDGPFDIVDHLLKEEYPRIVGLVETSLGGADAMLKSLHSAIESDGTDDEAELEDDAEIGEVYVERGTADLMQWRDDRFRRRGLDGYC